MSWLVLLYYDMLRVSYIIRTMSLSLARVHGAGHDRLVLRILYDCFGNGGVALDNDLIADQLRLPCVWVNVGYVRVSASV